MSDWQKSSLSAEGAHCVELRWQKSSFSGDSSNCVGVATGTGQAVHLRESDEPETVLTTSRIRLSALLAAVKASRVA